ncbi:hypothetical protein [Dyadobacter sp. MSC1_007]|uniref:hypothetical protein n=1 Tax=Dyadobacter sp. MSC1_007 TaxID=2909264 RepID=UPI00202F8480|nr:hypothetical protein [Dyadobacter sp. MSC1_007]
MRRPGPVAGMPEGLMATSPVAEKRTLLSATCNPALGVSVHFGTLAVRLWTPERHFSCFLLFWGRFNSWQDVYTSR